MSRRTRRVAVLMLVLALSAPACGSDGGSDGQVRIGLVTNNPNGMRNVTGFRQGLAEQGFSEGVNVTYLFAGEPLTDDALDAELERFATEAVDLVFTAGTPTGIAANRVLAGTDIPIVFGVIADPVSAGVLTDLDRPGGSITGVKLSQDQVRRLELFLEVLPANPRLLVPHNPEDNAASTAVAQIQSAVDGLGVDLVLQEATDDAAVTALIEGIDDQVDGIFLVNDSVVNARLADIVARAQDLRLPISGPSTAQLEGGALMVYGFIHERAGAHAARLAAQILDGADPGDIPVEDAESFLGLNLAAAAAIDLEVPDALVQQAEIVIPAGG